MEIQKVNLLKQIGKQLRRLKIDNNRTSKQIAALLNITPQAYGNIERGESDICITRLIFLAEYYEIPLLELIPEEFRSFLNNSQRKDSINKEKTSFNNKYMGLLSVK